VPELHGDISVAVQFWHAPADDVAATSRVVAALGSAFADAGVDAVVTSEKPVEPLTPPPPL
jgi:small conductance mechanosensitive channel